MPHVKPDKPPVYGDGSLEEDKQRGLTESIVSSPRQNLSTLTGRSESTALEYILSLLLSAVID